MGTITLNLGLAYAMLGWFAILASQTKLCFPHFEHVIVSLNEMWVTLCISSQIYLLTNSLGTWLKPSRITLSTKICSNNLL